MSSVMFDLSQSECHEVGVPLLATEPEPVVELDHGVSAVEGDLVAALFSCQKSQGCQQQLPQLSSSHLEMQECGLSAWTVRPNSVEFFVLVLVTTLGCDNFLKFPANIICLF